MDDAHAKSRQTGVSSSEVELNREQRGEADPSRQDVAARRSWLRARRSTTDTSMLVHWVDDKGSVVRLISSSDRDPTVRG